MGDGYVFVGKGSACDPNPCCVPDCTKKECGDDGCGGTCGECGPNEACTADGKCVAKGPFASPIDLVPNAEGMVFFPETSLYTGVEKILLSCGSSGDGSTNSIEVIDAATGQPMWGQADIYCYDAFLSDIPNGTRGLDHATTMVGCGPNACWFKLYKPDTSSWGTTYGIGNGLGNITDMVQLPDADPKRFLVTSFTLGLIGSLRSAENATMFGEPGWEYYGQVWYPLDDPDVSGSLISAWAPDFAGKTLIAITDKGDLWWVEQWNPTTKTRAATGIGTDLRRIRCLEGHCGITDFGSKTMTLVDWSATNAAPTVKGTVQVGDGAVGLDIRKDGANWLYLTTGYNDDTYTITTVGADYSVVSNVTTPMDAGCKKPGYATFYTDPALRYLAVSCEESGNAYIMPY